MIKKTSVLLLISLVAVSFLVGCGRGALTAASDASSEKPAAPAPTEQAVASKQIWFVQLSPAVKNFDAVAAEVAQRVNGSIQQSLPALRAIVVAVSVNANAKELFKDVRVRLVVTEKEYLTNTVTTPATKPAKKSDKKK